MPQVRCAHCSLFISSMSRRARGLCRRCHAVPRIRDSHAIRRPECAVHGLGLELGRRKSPVYPTEHLPGTKGKVQVLMERARRGEDLWHPEDATGLEE